jgi:hypothetical protein
MVVPARWSVNAICGTQRKNAWQNGTELETAATKYVKMGNDEMADRVRWIRSYVVNELGCGLMKPEPQASDFDHGKIVQGAAIVSGANVPELLELVEAAFDQRLPFLYLALL